MNYNITYKYIIFSNKCLTDYLRFVLKRTFTKEEIDSLLTFYNEIRYYNYDDRDLPLENKVNYHVKNEISNVCRKKEFPTNKARNIVLIVKYILYLDNVYDVKKIKEVVSYILNVRKKIFNDDIDSIELVDRIIHNNNLKKTFFESYKTKLFDLDCVMTSRKNVFMVDLIHYIKFPKIYSENIIEKVYKSDIIDEQRLLVKYNLVTIKILEEIINDNFRNVYIVDYPYSIFEKKEKMKRLNGIVDSDGIKEKLVIKIDYTNYLKYKDEVDTLIKEGFKVAVLLDGKFTYDNPSIKRLEIFKYLLITNLEDLVRLKEFEERVIIIKE